MAELQPGHPDELQTMLTKWLNQAKDATGTLLPAGIDPIEWTVRQFISAWRKPVRAGLDSIDESLTNALGALRAGDTKSATFELECAQQTLEEDVRNELGLYEWNRTND